MAESVVLFAMPILIFVFGLLLRRANAVHRPPLPPGPPADPIIGHSRLFPEKDPDVFYHELSKKYGKVMCLRLPRRTLIILNSTNAAIDLLEKRSSIYSDRPTSDVMLMMGFVANLVFFPYGEDFRRHRRLLNEYFHRRKCISYQPILALEARRLMESLTSSPDKFEAHLSRYAAAIILRIAHGHEIEGDDDPYLQITEAAEYAFSHCAIPGGNLVDLFPFLKNMPSWFPGTFAATQARLFRPDIDRMHDYPFEDVKQKMEKGIALESLISSELQNIMKHGDNHLYNAEDIKGAAAVVYIAGSDTTFSTLMIFILAMVLYPDIQSKAQEELDRLSEGEIRLPHFEDKRSLPFLEYVMYETYRWHSSVPSGTAHRCMKDDIYDGMFIPKGAIVIPNTRGMALDEDVYKNPHIFDPTRYERGEPKPIAQFGFGRRICPGRHLADSSIYIAMVYILSLFTISPVLDEKGNPAIPAEEFVSGITSRPKSFKCLITPRKKTHGVPKEQ